MADQRELEGSTSGTMRPAAPVSEGERIASIDVLRGVAVLGILAMNISAFGLAEMDFFNPTLGGNYDGVNRVAWAINHLVFDMKMMSLFSMLFGAGIILMTGRAQARGNSPAGLHYRRMGWLLLFGLIHAYFIWFGDILVAYALSGMIVYPLRRLRPRWLIAIGAASLLVALPINMGFGWMMHFMRSQAAEAAAARAAGQQPDELQAEMEKAWPELERQFNPGEDTLTAERDAMRGTYSDVFAHRFRQTLMMHFVLFPMMMVWRCCGLMLIGMALFKLGGFDARSAFPFRRLMLLGYALGLPLVLTGWWFNHHDGFDAVMIYIRNIWFNYCGSVLVALGHAGLVMLWCRAGVWEGARRTLGAVGRTAFSNYILQSLICTTIFYGYGLGYFDALPRWQLALVVLGVWAINLTLSPWWLSKFRFGPLEWLWRSLTYATFEPMRR